MHSSEGFYVLDDPLEGAIFLCFGRDDEADGEEKSGSLTSITTVMVCGQAFLTKILISFTALDKLGDFAFWPNEITEIFRPYYNEAEAKKEVLMTENENKK